MNHPVRTRPDPDAVRARILEVAEQHCRRIGYHKTSMADIASELGMSRANVYRFFPSRDAINESICRRVVSEVTDVAIAIARMDAPALEKLDRLLTAVHHHNKTKLIMESLLSTQTVSEKIPTAGKLTQASTTFDCCPRVKPQKWRRGIGGTAKLTKRGFCAAALSGRFCEGFRMPAHYGRSRALGGPAYENLQGRKPRVGSVWRCRERAAGAMGI